MKSPRSNQSSIRYSDEVSAVINNCPGETFGDRFEFVVLDYSEKYYEMQKRLKKLDYELKKKQNELTNLQQRINICAKFLDKLEIMKKGIEFFIDFSKDCNTSIEAAAPDPERQA